MSKKLMKLWLSQESVEILENYTFFHDTTMDDIADRAIRLFPWHEARTRYIQEFNQ